MIQLRIEFEETLSEMLDEKCGEKWKEYKLDSLIQTVIDILEIENSNAETWSITTKHLVKILKVERNRLKRFNEWNSRKNEQR